MSLMTQGLGIPTTFGVPSITLANQLLRSYSITTSEETIAEVDITLGSPTSVVVSIDNHVSTLNNLGSNHWEGIVLGNFTGEISNKEVIFIAFNTSASGIALAPSNLTVTHPTFKLYPDPVETVLTILEDDWIRNNTDGKKPEFKAVLDKDKYRFKEFSFKADTILVYGINEGEEAVGTGFEHINVTDVVRADMHTDGTRKHFRKMISEMKRILRFRRKAPPTKPANASNVYELMFFDGLGREFSDKKTGHFRFLQSVRLRKYWEDID